MNAKDLVGVFSDWIKSGSEKDCIRFWDAAEALQGSTGATEAERAVLKYARCELRTDFSDACGDEFEAALVAIGSANPEGQRYDTGRN